MCDTLRVRRFNTKICASLLATGELGPLSQRICARQAHEMSTNRTLHKQIAVALFCLRSARFDGDVERMEVAEAHMNRLLEKLLVSVEA